MVAILSMLRRVTIRYKSMMRTSKFTTIGSFFGVVCVIVCGSPHSTQAQSVKKPSFAHRLTLDVAWQGAWIGAQDHYGFFVHDLATGREATGQFVLNDSGYAQGGVIDATFRVGPRFGVGLETWYQRRLTAPSNPMPEAVDIQFGHRDYFGISGLFEYTPQSRDYSPRRGLFVQGTAGIFRFWDHRRTGSNVVEVNGAYGGDQIAANLGYRVPIGNSVSLALACSAGYNLLSGPMLGIRLGGGIQ